jgi:hypothetical protein
MTKAVFKALGIPVFVKGLGPETTFAELLGGIDVPELLRSGASILRTGSSFMAHPYVVFEEILDASGLALKGLKDLLTDGYFRNGEQQAPLVTKTLIGATNKDPEEFAQDDDSSKAFLARFRLRQKVFWPSHGAHDYQRFLRKKIALPEYSPKLCEESDSSVTSLIEMLSFVLAELSEPGREVAPRLALQCFDEILLARQHLGHRLVWNTDFEYLLGILGIEIGLGNTEPITTSISGAVGRYGYALCCNQVRDRIARLTRRYEKAEENGDYEDEYTACMTEHGNIEKFLVSMIPLFSEHKREINVLQKELVALSNSKRRKK